MMSKMIIINGQLLLHPHPHLTHLTYEEFTGAEQIPTVGSRHAPIPNFLSFGLESIGIEEYRGNVGIGIENLGIDQDSIGIGCYAEK